MERINYNSLKIIQYIDKLNPQNSGIFFSILFHLFILLFAVGVPNFFGPKNIFVPNIIPIEILNVSETTNLEKSQTDQELNNNSTIKQKKFNSSDNKEIQKQFQIDERVKKIENNNQAEINIKEKINVKINEKKNIEVSQKNNFEIKNKVETLKTNEIKPKIKPKLTKQEKQINKSDIEIEKQNKVDIKKDKKNVTTVPKTKPEEDFSIASMLKDLRNEQSNVVEKENIKQDDNNQTGNDNNNENMTLSISEVDLLRQQLSSCWNAPAGAVINVGDKVTISAKVQQNMRVFPTSLRIIDTNISKSNPFYGPITDSAMRTLLNPECTPLKLPENKYNLWKNLTITFDYSIMKGY